MKQRSKHGDGGGIRFSPGKSLRIALYSSYPQPFAGTLSDASTAAKGCTEAAPH
jgi:hypothetical protein